jgi:hypothetical protein
MTIPPQLYRALLWKSVQELIQFGRTLPTPTPVEFDAKCDAIAPILKPICGGFYPWTSLETTHHIVLAFYRESVSTRLPEWTWFLQATLLNNHRFAEVVTTPRAESTMRAIWKIYLDDT